ncbi:MAG: trehalase-like domain-containing protein [Streptosporangiaceae bacterium]
MTKFPPIADYAFLSDCEQSCLVAPDGSVEWLCLPRPDSPSVFGALLDRSAGQFRFGPTHAQVPQQRQYVPGTMVLETTWHTPGGWLVVRDLLVTDRTDVGHRREHYHRAPTDYGATGVLLRTATCISGQVEVMADCAPLFSRGTVEGTWSYQDEGYERMTVAPAEGDLRLDVCGSIRLGTLGIRSYGRTTLTEGESAYLTLSWGGSRGPASWEEATTALNATIGYWRDWLSTARLPDHPWRPYLERTALTLKGLSCAPTGVIMAASTTSLP